MSETLAEKACTPCRGGTHDGRSAGIGDGVDIEQRSERRDGWGSLEGASWLQ
jgi:hypothetical protein